MSDIIDDSQIIEIIFESPTIVEISEKSNVFEMQYSAPGPKGEKGDPGEKGEPGESATSYLHDQQVASNTWLISHNLQRFPSVTVVDSSGNVVYGDVTYVTENEVTINFSGAFSGKAYLN